MYWWGSENSGSIIIFHLSKYEKSSAHVCLFQFTSDPGTLIFITSIIPRFPKIIPPSQSGVSAGSYQLLSHISSNYTETKPVHFVTCTKCTLINIDPIVFSICFFQTRSTHGLPIIRCPQKACTYSNAPFLLNLQGFHFPPVFSFREQWHVSFLPNWWSNTMVFSQIYSSDAGRFGKYFLGWTTFTWHYHGILGKYSSSQFLMVDDLRQFSPRPNFRHTYLERRISMTGADSRDAQIYFSFKWVPMNLHFRA